LRVESDGAAKVDGAELTPLDESLHRSRMNVQKRGGFVRRQQRAIFIGRFPCRCTCPLGLAPALST
jgi:hypothetical protein